MAKLFNPNRTSASAVTEIDAVYFYNFDSNNGEEPVINADWIEDADLFPVATLKGSVEINQDDITINKINIDQSNVPIGITTEPGDFNFSGNMPSMLADDLAKFLTKGDDLVNIDNKAGYGYTLDGKILEMAVVVRMKSGDYLIFPRTNVTCTLKMEDNVMLLHFAGQVLGATNPANKDVYILADPSGAKAALKTINFGVITDGSDPVEPLKISYNNVSGNIALSIVGDDASVFAVDKASITPDNSGVATVNVTFNSPTAAGVYNAVLKIESGSGDSEVQLKGEVKTV